MTRFEQPAVAWSSMEPLFTTEAGASVRKYGERLSEAQRTRAREVLERHQRMLMRVRNFELENGDAPATGLRLQPEKRL